MLESEATEFALDREFVEVLLSKQQYQTIRQGLTRVAEILRTLEDARSRGVS